MDTKAEPEWLHDLPKAESLPWEELFGGREDLKKKKFLLKSLRRLCLSLEKSRQGELRS